MGWRGDLIKVRRWERNERWAARFVLLENRSDPIMDFDGSFDESR